MRAILLLLIMLSFAQARAEQKEFEGSTPKELSPAQMERLSALMAEEEMKAVKPEVPIGKKLRAKGPLVSTFKVKKATDIPRRLLRLINPFAAPEGSPTLEERRNLSTRAWASTVGFNAGKSAFPDATTHEPTMTLLTVGR